MKIVLLLSAVLAFCAAEAKKNGFRPTSNVKGSKFQPNVQLQHGTFETPLDHFSPTDDRRLHLTYSANLKYFKGTGPLFFYTPLLDTSTYYIERGLVHDLARETGGALITANARYFGRNCWGNTTVENLRHLTIDHVLADIPHLIAKVKEDLGAENSRVIVWSSRVGGTIAALARKKFPHIIHGVWSSDGVFRAVPVERQFFNSVAWNIHRLGPENCSNVLASALQQFQQLVVAREGQTLQRLFNLCEPVDFENPQNVQEFYETIFKYIGWYIDEHGYAGIRNFCTALVHKNDPLKAFARWVRYFYGGRTCQNMNYVNTINSKRYSGCDSRRRQFAYFHCTQFGMVLHVTNENDFGGVFPNVITEEFQHQRCRDVFGDVFNSTLLERAANNFDLQYGSQNQIISNAIFTNGELNPYFSLGIADYDVYTSEALTTQYSGGEDDLDSISDTDSTQLLKTKRAVLSALTRFAFPDGIDDGDSDGKDETPSPHDLDLAHGQL